MTRSICCNHAVQDNLPSLVTAERRSRAATTIPSSLLRALRSVLRLHGYRNLRGRILDDLLTGVDGRD